MDKDLYEILGVKREASEAEIKNAFRKLAKQHHPDKNQGNKVAETKFKELSLAYEVLKDPTKRARYDQARVYGGGGGMGGPGGGQWKSSPGFKPEDMFQDFGLGDLFQEIFGAGGAGGGHGGRGDFGRDFGGGFGQTGRRGFGARRGADLEAQLEISLPDAVQGAEKTVHLNGGKRLTVKIPEGIDEGSKIRLTGQGQPGANGGPAGDLIVQIRIAAHPVFRREGDNLIARLPISFSEAVLGGEVAVPTIDGQVTMKIPAGVSSGQKLKLSGKGVKNSRTGNKGDLLVELMIRIPSAGDPLYVEAAEKLREGKFNPRENLFK